MSIYNRAWILERDSPDFNRRSVFISISFQIFSENIRTAADFSCPVDRAQDLPVCNIHTHRFCARIFEKDGTAQ